MSKQKVRVYELVDQKKSGYIRQGTEGTANQVELTCAKTTTLSNRSRVYIDEKNGYRSTVYYPGCPTIFEHDYFDADGNKVQGLISQGVDVKQMVNNNKGCIKFINGKFVFIEGVDDPLLELFLTTSHNYISNDEKDTKRPRTVASPIKFVLHKSEKKALVDLGKGGALSASMRIYDSMVKLIPGKTKEYQFVTYLLDYYLSLLNVGVDSSISDAEKATLILAYIHQDPEDFQQTIVSKENHYGIQYRLGFDKKIIRFSESDATVLQYRTGISDNGEAQWKDVYKTSSSDIEKREMEAKAWIFGSPVTLEQPQKIKAVILNLI